MLSYRHSLNHMHKNCITFQDNLYKYKRKILSQGHSYPKLLQGQMEGMVQDTSELLLRACTEVFQANSKISELSVFITNWQCLNPHRDFSKRGMRQDIVRRFKL